MTNFDIKPKPNISNIIAKVKTQFICSNCGFTSARYLGRCSNCGEWGTFVEVARPTTHEPKVEKINEVTSEETPRVATNLKELNRVLGGGVVPGSMVLIGGDPGIGKSTLLLQVSGQLAHEGRVLYVTGEESATQVKLRADRLGVGNDEFYLYPETDMTAIKKQIESLQPDFVVIDSVQTMQEPDVTSAIGSVSQIPKLRQIYCKL